MAAFASASDLAARLNVTFTSGQTAQATQLLDGASAYIRALVGGYVSAVAGDVATLVAPPGYWLHLPHGPVTAVASVVLDGETITDYQRVGRRLYLADGWRSEFAADSISSEDDDLDFVVVTYSHGYTSTDDLALAKDACLSMAAASVANVSGVKRERIDDYEIEFGELNRSSLGPNLERMLVKKYGARPSTGSVAVQ